METVIKDTNKIYYTRWLFMTFAGWLLGLLSFFILGGFFEVIGLGEYSEVAIGMGMGLGVGLMQWFVARKWFNASIHWITSSFLCMGFPIVLNIIIDLYWKKFPVQFNDSFIGALIYITLGALLTGIWQKGLLGSHARKPGWWILICFAGWMFSAFITIGIMFTRTTNALDAVKNMAAIPLGGLIFALITGQGLKWILLSK